ncbi:MAG: NAD-dependent epimerase/dehydratase family protein [Terracidiphilus sp.]
MATKRILVTGGTGFLGSALVRNLIHKGHSVRILDDGSRGSVGRLEDIRSQFEFVDGDVRNAEIVRSATKGMDAVAHLAFVNGTEYFYSNPELVLDVAVKGAINTLEAAIAENVEDYYLMSSSEVYQTPPIVPTDETVPISIPDVLNPRYSYGGGKIISELMAINYGRHRFRHVVIVRPHNVYGPSMGREHVIPQLALRLRDALRQYPHGAVPLPIQGDGTQTRAFIYVDDFTDGCVRAFFEGDHLGIYHVGTESEVTIAKVAKMVGAVYGREIDLQTGPPKPGGTARRCPNTAKIRSLGFVPRVSLEEGIRKTVEWYAKN